MGFYAEKLGFGMQEWVFTQKSLALACFCKSQLASRVSSF